MKNLLLITIALLGFTTNVLSQNIEFYRGVNVGDYDFVNKSVTTTEYRTPGDLILHDGAQVLGDNTVVYCRNFIVKGNAALRHNSHNFMIIYSGYTNFYLQ